MPSIRLRSAIFAAMICVAIPPLANAAAPSGTPASTSAPKASPTPAASSTATPASTPARGARAGAAAGATRGAARGATPGATGGARRGAAGAGATASRNDPAVQNVKPFKVFDNLHYVGIQWVGAWILSTDDGLILIDSLYDPFIDRLIENIKTAGFDPKNIKYVLVTHAHFDHVGGAKKIKELSGAKIGMTDADWKIVEEMTAGGGRAQYDAPARDMTIKDGDTLKLGSTELHFFVTPGHTTGVLSMDFPVKDADKTYKAFLFGGVSLNFNGVERTQSYVDSVKRIQKLEGIQVNIPNHPDMGRVFQRQAQLNTRLTGEPHPFVDPDGFKTWIDGLLVEGEKKLKEEKGQ